MINGSGILDSQLAGHAGDGRMEATFRSSHALKEACYGLTPFLDENPGSGLMQRRPERPRIPGLEKEKSDGNVFFCWTNALMA
jgi:hypothetical protein